MNKIVAASILNADFGVLAEEIKAIEGVADIWLHLDVMDGNFVENLSYGSGLIASLRDRSKLFFDVHLMIADPLKYYKSYVDAGADLISFHYEAIMRQLITKFTSSAEVTACKSDDEEDLLIEATEQILDILKLIRKSKIKCGLAINPNTKVEIIESLLGQVDLINVMSVEPGFGGQKLIPNTYQKVAKLASIRKETSRDFIIEVDGGVSVENAKQLYNMGADVLVAGSYIFGSKNYLNAINNLR